MEDRLYRSRVDRMIAGVAGGMAERWDLDPSIVRLLWVLGTIFTGGIAFIGYIVLAVVVPEDPTGYVPPPPIGSVPRPGAPGSPNAIGELQAQRAAEYADARDARRAERRAARAARRSDGGRGIALVVGLVLIGIGAWYLIRRYVPWLDTDLLWPLAIIVLGVAVLVLAVRSRAGGGGQAPRDDEAGTGASGT